MCYVQGEDSHTWDEVMMVAYKSRWQFMQMALLTPGYWPLACAPTAHKHVLKWAGSMV